MKRKLMAMILTVCFVLSSAISAFALDIQSIDAAVGQFMQKFSQKERKDLIDSIVPLLAADSFVDSRIEERK